MRRPFSRRLLTNWLINLDTLLIWPCLVGHRIDALPHLRQQVFREISGTVDSEGAECADRVAARWKATSAHSVLNEEDAATFGRDLAAEAPELGVPQENVAVANRRVFNRCLRELEIFPVSPRERDRYVDFENSSCLQKSYSNHQKVNRGKRADFQFP